MALLTMLAGINVAYSQATADSMGKVLPVHLYACNYNDGKDASDMSRVIERWNRFMDEQGVDTYAAWTLVPYHFGGERTADVMWLGAYRDGNAMALDNVRQRMEAFFSGESRVEVFPADDRFRVEVEFPYRTP